MQISSRFTVALHLFACMDVFGADHKITSDFLADSIGTNPVIVRKIMVQLQDAGLIRIARGTGGITAEKPYEQTTFYDVYKAVEAVQDDTLFRFHDKPNPQCPVGRNIHTLLDAKLADIQNAMEEEMRRHTLSELREGMRDILQSEVSG